jgi:hypothetical protein
MLRNHLYETVMLFLTGVGLGGYLFRVASVLPPSTRRQCTDLRDVLNPRRRRNTPRRVRPNRAGELSGSPTADADLGPLRYSRCAESPCAA